MRPVIYPWTGPVSEPGNQLFAQRNPWIVRKFVLYALRYARSMDCSRNPWIVAGSMDPWFVQRNPWIVQIHTLCPTYTLHIWCSIPPPTVFYTALLHIGYIPFSLIIPPTPSLTLFRSVVYTSYSISQYMKLRYI